MIGPMNFILVTVKAKGKKIILILFHLFEDFYNTFPKTRNPGELHIKTK